MATVRNQSVSIRLRGSAIEDRKRAANISGKMPCTASPEPVRSATNAPMRPKPSEISSDSAAITSAPATPAWMPAPAITPTTRKVDGLDQPERHHARELAAPAARCGRSGVSDSRLRKPDSTSLATLVPALFAANRPPWTKHTASTKSR